VLGKKERTDMKSETYGTAALFEELEPCDFFVTKTNGNPEYGIAVRKTIGNLP
jgi:hypothetical protein